MLPAVWVSSADAAWRWLGAALVAVAALGVGGYLLVDSLRGGDQAGPGPGAGGRRPRAAARGRRRARLPGVRDQEHDPGGRRRPGRRRGGCRAGRRSPRPGASRGPTRSRLVDGGDWPSGIAAASLVAPPVRAPILITGADSVPSLTADALRALAPAGSPTTDGHQVFAVGSAAAPSGVRVERVGGGDPAELARGDRPAPPDAQRAPARSTSCWPAPSEPQYAMPAAAWAARSGDPVLFVGQGIGPRADARRTAPPRGRPGRTRSGRRRRSRTRCSSGSARSRSSVTRIGAEDPVQNAIDFARYVDGSFGWNINDPGHGFVIASDSRPLDAAAAARPVGER